MSLERFRNSSILKILCYILIPILVGIAILSIIHIQFLYHFNVEDEQDYTKTEMFANNYYYFIRNRVSECQNKNELFIKVQNKDNVYFYNSERYSNYYNNNYNELGKYINYIIIDKNTNEIYTNIKSEDYTQEMKNINQNNIYWNYENGNINTNIKHINQNNIAYQNYSDIFKTDDINNYNIYTKFDESKSTQETNFNFYKNIYTLFIKYKSMPVYSLVISLALLTITVIYLFWSIGHKNGEKGIYLNSIDRIPYEVLLIICLNIIIIALTILANIIYIINYINIVFGMIAYFICYAACCVIGVSTIKRIKAKQFIKSFLLYKIFKWFDKKIRKISGEFKNKSDYNRKIFVYYWGFILISTILICMMWSGLVFILLTVFWIWTFYKIRQYIKNQENIKNTLKDIYQGKKIEKIDENDLSGILKEMAIYINDISDGFSNAIEQSLKSERLKTELITNVSHDIKTPLTSIINYVNILKKEDINDEKIKEYIDILDKKSQRLKKLTEDLVEASKFSSGNVKLNIEDINLMELINQTAGEFKDRFEEKGLILETKFPEQKIIIKADNRYMYRIMDNLFGNITKYALENSRVYIDLVENRQKVIIEIKNISKEKLNISANELIQRFVRGDKSRYTEGSGLGLSIAESLTKLQNGKFEIIIDGDLFKVQIEFHQKS